ncbi:MAG: S9 family peptidase [Paludibacteraceae bacterium]
MKQSVILLLILLITTYQTTKADILTDITDGKFRAKTPASLRSLQDGKHFTQLIDGKLIVKFNYKNGRGVDTLLNLKCTSYPHHYISGYEFSRDEKKILIYSYPTYRYRRTFTADYHIYDVVSQKLTKLSEKGKQETPLFSPDGNFVAFARENNIFLKNLKSGVETAVTFDGKWNKIINGTPDWVYEEEFETTRYFTFSPDNQTLAFIRFDESKVPLFYMMRYTNEKLRGDELLLYPEADEFKYPKAGQNNSTVSLHLYGLKNNVISKVQLPQTSEDFYIPRLKWSNDNNQLAVYVLNRHQNRLNMYLVHRQTLQSINVWSDEDPCYVDYENIDNIQFLSDNKQFVYVSEQNGYRHAYLYNINSRQSKQITLGNWDVTRVYGYDEKRQILYYQSAETSPVQRDIYAITLEGKKKRLTGGEGIHQADFSAGYDYFVDNFSSLSMPNIVTLRDNRGKSVRELMNNQKLLNEFSQMNFPRKEFFRFKSSAGDSLNGWIIKPFDMLENKKYPLLMVQYSGPNSQQVLDSWSIGWEYYLAMQGYAVACVDGRGTGARGSKFRKCTYKQLGVLEAEDQIDAAKYLGQLSYIDKDRIGIWGWSYGGFMVLNVMSSGEDIFKAGIAVAPVTDWRLYNTAYTERFMQTPQENSEGYKAGSPLSKVEKLQGNLLIIHGTADDNVHIQNTMIYLSRLTDVQKQVQLYTYTDKNHSILGEETRRNLYQKKFDFLEECLK